MDEIQIQSKSLGHRWQAPDQRSTTWVPLSARVERMCEAVEKEERERERSESER